MPRIPDAKLERLKAEVSLLRLIESQGHTLVKRGKDWAMRCIFHEDATATRVSSHWPAQCRLRANRRMVLAVRATVKVQQKRHPGHAQRRQGFKAL